MTSVAYFLMFCRTSLVCYHPLCFVYTYYGIF